MTKGEEEIYIKERIRLANNDFDVIGVDPNQASWLRESMYVTPSTSTGLDMLNKG